MLRVNDWFRTLSVLGVTFIAVIVFTLGLTMVIVPGPVGSPQADDDTPGGPSATQTAIDGSGGIGGTLTFSGDHTGTFTVSRESSDGRDRRYGLRGDDGRIFFSGDPLTVVQMEFDALSFFPEPDECTLTPGALNEAIGVAAARLHCGDITDIRGNGVVSVEGTLGLAGDVLGMRGDLPPSGGSIEVGGETLTFSEARMSVGPRPVVVGGRLGSRVADEDGDSALGFDYDVRTHELRLVSVEVDGAFAEVADGACAISTRALGVLNPRTTVIDVALRCAAVAIPGLGSVPIDGSIIVDLSEGSF